jgi:hypothetical protein
MFNDQIECYEAIANDLANSVNESWSKIKVDVERFGDDSINTLVVYYLPDGREIGSTDAQMIPFYFDALANLVSTPEKGLYKKCIFILHNDGKYDTEFEY